ncbi:alpha/beta fold hydrolase [Halosimplex rubrum]|uniref:Alpha/beta fold hydrolase n=1 Tax=Halosimplex rubrum TaxID=869889 RepID=A0A7D5TN46_9EURY|nr:alpha/beta fold hydrolase [Halosimplex rubrum]QLH78772.1 alpha/beta fold hydrolase [Halosimplex rubrum]
MAHATNDEVRIAYDVAGPAEAETVTFLEGLAYGTWMWNWQREALSEYRTVVMDNRGTGDSDAPEGPYTVAEMAADLEAVLDDAGIERTHLVGASLGGMIAQRYALDYDRAESLALLCTTPGGDDAVPIPEETQARMLAVPDEYGPSETIRHKMEPAFSDEFWAANQEVVDRIVDWRLETDPSADAYEWQSAAAVGFDAGDELDGIDLPTLVLHGTDDRVLPPENARLLAEGIPGAELVAVEGGSHLFFVERDERVTDELREFVEDV